MTLFDKTVYSADHKVYVSAKNQAETLAFCRDSGVEREHMQSLISAYSVKPLENVDIVVIGKPDYHQETEIMLAKLNRGCRIARIESTTQRPVFSP